MSSLKKYLYCSVLVFVALFALAAADAWEDEENIEVVPEVDLSLVTCGSVIKLRNADLGFRLHSHDVKYGGGSGQQSVTGVPNGDDPNSYWIVKEPHGDNECVQG